MKKVKFYSGIKKCVLSVIIVTMVTTSTLTMTSCITKEEREISAGIITIDDTEYAVSDIYLLTEKDNPKEEYICIREKIGSYFDVVSEMPAPVYAYIDIKSEDVIATSHNGAFNFNKEAKEKYTKEKQDNIKGIGNKHMNISKLSRLIDYETASEKEFMLGEEDIIKDSIKTKKYN